MRAEFTDDLITGNELIDSQHEELIGRINKLLDSCEADEDKNIRVYRSVGEESNEEITECS